MTLLITNPNIPRRGEIWLVNFDPTVGAEIKKIRPAIVISSDSVGKLPIKLIAPVTDWKPYLYQIRLGKYIIVKARQEAGLLALGSHIFIHLCAFSRANAQFIRG